MSAEPSRVVAADGAKGELIALQAGVFGLRAIALGEGSFGALLDAALASVAGRHGRALHVRLSTAERPSDHASSLIARGFARVSERVEFEALVEGLPNDATSPLTWAALPDLADNTLRDAGRLLNRAGHGDPDWGDDDEGLELLKGYLAETGLTRGPECIAVGTLEGSPAAIVVAQVNHSTGVGRITYLGVAPECRGRGLGTWVHRHGFAMLKAQGAERYRGGTLANNLPMLQLFSLHGCAEWRRLEEWVWRKNR